MNIDVDITKDELTPQMERALKHVSNKKPLLEAGGLVLVSRAQGAFTDESLRPRPWPARKRGSNPLLRKSGALAQSIRIISASNDAVIVGTDRPYAVFHQRGTRPYVIRPRFKKALFWPGARHPVKKINHPGLPARPFFPVAAGRILPDAKREVNNAMARTLAGKLGLPPNTFL